MNEFQNELSRRILVLDGAMGTMIQRLVLTERDFRGERFADHPLPLQGNNDILSITCPDAVYNIHRQYIEAGADIITTNSFNANAISQADYQTAELVGEINRCAASIARKAADDAMAEMPQRRIRVAGSVGPTNRTASMSPKMEDPAYRNVDYDMLYNTYYEQIDALVDGGCDILLFETVFDTLNLKAGLDAARQVFADRAVSLPVMVSATVAGKSGRILSGQSIEALWTTISSYEMVVSFGLNCSWGADEMKPFIVEASRVSDAFISCHPNAGLPDEFGHYKETPETFVSHVESFLKDRCVNIVGGCCGTTPEHIACLSRVVGNYQPHVPTKKRAVLYVSGLDTLEISREKNFVNIGERCNVAGSRKFLRLIKEKNYDEALTIATRQVADGAQILDINMDDALVDAKAEMTHFLNLMASDPEVARVPVMIDSSQWDVLAAALKCLQGKCIVNSISLKEGERVFLERARYIRRHGAAVVVMAFDEKGQADTFERKIEICGRAYRLLVDEVGFDPCDVIFDPNVMAIATGIEEHDLYARDFIRATQWIKSNLPGAKVSGGVSNLSFSFRGNNRLRESMHAVFLYHAIVAGLDMAIVNPATSVTYSDIDGDLREILDELITEGSHEASKRLCEHATSDLSMQSDSKVNVVEDRRKQPVGTRLSEAVIKGDSEHLEEDLEEAAVTYERAIDIIEGPLMDGVNTVGELFGEGKMFLPQVVKTARVMKRAVDLLKPRINSENSGSAESAGKILFATVKGDVHDIGKNIVAIVLECNNYEVVDLGVMVPAERIVDEALRLKPDIICLSGLITPSLGEMIHVADCLEEAGLKIPLIVGGATTSRLHTALSIAPHLSAPVVHAADASQNPIIASKLVNPLTRSRFADELAAEYDDIRRKHNRPALLGLSEARSRAEKTDWSKYTVAVPRNRGVRVIDHIDLKEIRPLINWRMFFHAWRLTGDSQSSEALTLYDEATRILDVLEAAGDTVVRAAVGVFEAGSRGDDITVGGVTLPMLRRQLPGDNGVCRSLADYVMPETLSVDGRRDYVGAFAVTAGLKDDKRYAELGLSADRYSELVLRTVLDRIAEAASEYVHRYVRTDYWAYSPDEQVSDEDLLKGDFQGIRPAIGYPMIPDQLLNLRLRELLPFEELGVEMTENGAMNPPASVSGLYIAHPGARYFMIENIGEDQLEDYASRRDMPIESLRKVLARNLE